MIILLRIISGILAVFLITGYIIVSIIDNNWFGSIGVPFLSAFFVMYALRGNNWPQWRGYPYMFKNVNKKDDANDDDRSIDFSWFKNLFWKKK